MEPTSKKAEDPDHGIAKRFVILICYCGHQEVGGTDAEAGERMYQHRMGGRASDGSE